MKILTWIWRILFGLLFSILPALPFYLQLLNHKSSEYQILIEQMPIIIGLLITITIFSLVILIYYLHDKTMKRININEIIFNAALEGIDQNSDGKSYTNKENRVLDALKKNPNLSSKEIDEIMRDKFPAWTRG